MKWYIGGAILILLIGFFAGRWTVEEKVKTEYVKGDTVRDTLLVDNPYEVYIPVKPLLPVKPIIINHTEYMIVDTAQIIANYITMNSYKKLMFDDLNGRLTVSAEVQYNRLNRLSYEFTPIQKQTTITRRDVFTPFVSSSWNSFGMFGIGGGLYYHDIGLGAKYITDFTRNGFEIGLNVKF